LSKTWKTLRRLGTGLASTIFSLPKITGTPARWAILLGLASVSLWGDARAFIIDHPFECIFAIVAIASTVYAYDLESRLANFHCVTLKNVTADAEFRPILNFGQPYGQVKDVLGVVLEYQLVNTSEDTGHCFPSAELMFKELKSRKLKAVDSKIIDHPTLRARPLTQHGIESFIYPGQEFTLLARQTTECSVSFNWTNENFQHLLRTTSLYISIRIQIIGHEDLTEITELSVDKRSLEEDRLTTSGV
jgi:hypothetical protein